MYLEQHLLSLYRKAFEQQITHLSPSAGNGIEIDSKKQMSSPSEALPKAAPTLDSSPRKQNPSTNVQSGQIVLPRKSATGRQSEACAVPSQDKRSSFRVHRSHSSLLQRSVCSARVSPSARNLARALKACHTLPLSFPEVADQVLNFLLCCYLACGSLTILVSSNLSKKLVFFFPEKGVP